MKWCCPCSLHFGRVCLYNTQPSVVTIFCLDRISRKDHLLVDLLLKLHWHWSIGTQMNHQFEVVPLIAARCQASSQRWDDFFYFLFSHSRWTINIQRKNFHKTHTRVCSRHFPRCGQMWSYEVHIYLRKKSPDLYWSITTIFICDNL